MDGAGEFRSFVEISFPLLRDVYMVVLLISGVDTLKVFDIIYSLTGGGPNNSTVSMRDVYKRQSTAWTARRTAA